MIPTLGLFVGQPHMSKLSNSSRTPASVQPFKLPAEVNVGYTQRDLELGAMMGHTVRNLCSQLLLRSLGAVQFVCKPPMVQGGSKLPHL